MIEIKPEVQPIETVTPIKPSEAIRLGCLIAPLQAFGGLGKGPRACAMGAMYLGAGFQGAIVGPESFEFTLPVQHLPCPEGCDGTPQRGGLVTPAHLNDDHRWSRERIADWLESLGL